MRRTALARRLAYLPQNPRCEWPIAVERLAALGLTPPAQTSLREQPPATTLLGAGARRGSRHPHRRRAHRRPRSVPRPRHRGAAAGARGGRQAGHRGHPRPHPLRGGRLIKEGPTDETLTASLLGGCSVCPPVSSRHLGAMWLISCCRHRALDASITLSPWACGGLRGACERAAAHRINVNAAPLP